jgi:hypothetical protein
MMTVVDDDDTQDWAAGCDGEGQQRAMRDGGDSRVVMMAVVVEDCNGGRWWQRRTTIAAEDNGMQDWVADYDGEGQERAAKEGGDSGVVMMAAAVEDGGGGQQWQRWRTTAMADDDSGGWRQQRMMMAHKIEWRTMRGKEESGWQTTTALGQPGRACETKKKSSLRKKTFFAGSHRVLATVVDDWLENLHALAPVQAYAYVQ